MITNPTEKELNEYKMLVALDAMLKRVMKIGFSKGKEE